MKKLSRMLALVMALVLALGCMQAVAAAEELPEVDLIYWCGANPDQKDAELVLGEMKKVAKDALNVNLDMVIVATSEFKEKFNKAMAAQERVDLTWTGYIQSIQELVNLGALMPLDDLMAEYGKDLIASLDERLLDAHRQADGKLYQFPAWQGMVGNRSYYMFPKAAVDATLGEAWVEEMQKLMYDNWDKNTVENQKPVYEQLEKLLAATKDAGVMGLGYNPTNECSFSAWYSSKSIVSVGSYGYIDLWDDTFTVKASCDNPWSIERHKMMAEWYDKGYIRADIASLESTQDEKLAGFQDETGNTPCYITYGHNGFTDDLSKELAGTKIDVYTVHTNPYCWTTLGQATGTSIPFTCGEPERAMMFMNWLVTKDEKAIEFYNLYSYGIEGKHYEWNEAHTDITVFGGDGQADSSFDWGQRPWMMGTLLNAYSCAVYPAPYYEELIKLQEDAYTSPLLGFNFDYTDVETEYNLLSSIGKEYGSMLDCGYLGAAGVEAKEQEYRDKMYAAGLQDVIDAIQEQVTAFVEKNERTW
ncbi:MAG: ABC transporter substrate-binding protein [Clostridiales bacterium]|nr:ABC transporter substrate-binding protein [Clostridiales bacterium]